MSERVAEARPRPIRGSAPEAPRTQHSLERGLPDATNTAHDTTANTAHHAPEPPPPGVAFGSLAGARDIFLELDSPTPRPFVYLIRGRSGTGKTALLNAVRLRLADRGIRTLDRPEAPAEQQVLIVDDAHLLSPPHLDRLCAATEERGLSMIAATQPRPHHPGLRELTAAVHRHGRVVELRPLGPSGMTPFARELGLPVPTRVADRIHRRTGGIRGGVVVALLAACAARRDEMDSAVDAALSDWIHTQLTALDPALSDTLAVAAAGAGFDPDELGGILGLEAHAAQDLIDRARATALVTDADLLLADAITPLRETLGEQRFHAILHRLCTARLAAGRLSAHTALTLAEFGVRDSRLAELLATTAERAGTEAARYAAAAVAGGADPGLLARCGTPTAPCAEPADRGDSQRPRPNPEIEPAGRLTDREQEIAELVLLGLTYREIGARLYISAKTVEHHIARIRHRIGAGSRAELLSMLRAMGQGMPST
nr:helix-turn-helix transcriptional regulator [Nocardia paucivorans]